MNGAECKANFTGLGKNNTLASPSRQWKRLLGDFRGPWSHSTVEAYEKQGRQPFYSCMGDHGSPRLLVIFREPVERFFSFITFFSRFVDYLDVTKPWFREGGTFINASEASIRSFFSGWKYNLPLLEYERVFGNPHRTTINSTAWSSLKVAKARLEDEFVVGLAEHMDETIVLFAAALQLPMSALCPPWATCANSSRSCGIKACLSMRPLERRGRASPISPL